MIHMGEWYTEWMGVPVGRDPRYPEELVIARIFTTRPLNIHHVRRLIDYLEMVEQAWSAEEPHRPSSGLGEAEAMPVGDGNGAFTPTTFSTEAAP